MLEPNISAFTIGCCSPRREQAAHAVLLQWEPRLDRGDRSLDAPQLTIIMHNQDPHSETPAFASSDAARIMLIPGAQGNQD